MGGNCRGLLPAALVVLAVTAVTALARPGSAAEPIITEAPSALPAIAYVGDTIRFSVAARDGAGLVLSYRWRFGDSTAGADYGPASGAVHVYGEPGHYRASIYVRNSDGEYVNRFLPVTVHTRPAAIRATSSSSIILDTALGRIWCVNPDHGSVSALDAKSRSLLFEVATGASPQSLARAPDGSIWVANRGAATLSVLAGQDGKVVATLALPYGSRPHGLAFNPAGTEAYVSLEGSGKLLKLDPAARKVIGEAALGPTPRALAVSGDGRRILVTRFISPADHAEVYEVDAGPFVRVRTFRLDADLSTDTETSGGGVLNYLAAISISPDGRKAVVPAVKANTRRGRLVSGIDLIPENTVRTALAYIDLDANAEYPSTRNDFDNSAMASAVAYSPMGDLIFTALEGSNAVHTRDPYNNGAVLERNKAVGPAPIGLALDPRTGILYVHSFLGRSVSAWDVSVYDDPGAIEKDSVQSRPLGLIPTVTWEALPPQVLQGKRVFYDAANPAMSFNGYVSCAVCHLDGGTDNRVWDFTGRGEGLRRTTSLLGRAGMGHGPVHWSANFDEIQDFENDIRGPFGGTGLMADAHFLAGTRSKTLGDGKAGLAPDLDALAAYVGSLAKVNASPYRAADGAMTADARAGEAIFNSDRAGCARCHVPPLYTDSRLPGLGGAGPATLLPGDFLTPQGFLVHDVGTLKASSGQRQGDTLRGIDTPTLKGIWETGPYLHDGSAASLGEVIGAANPDDRHGGTSHLDAREKEQLVAFLLQLDDGPAPVVGLRPVPGAKAFRGGLNRMAAGTRIRLPAAMRDARLTVHDLQGRQVAGLDRGRPGLDGTTWEWTWNGQGAGGSVARAGVYQVRVRGRGQAGDLALSLTWLP